MKFKLQAMLYRRCTNMSRFSKRYGFHYKTIFDLAHGKKKYISFEMMERICKILECTPNDLFEVD